MNLPHMTPLCLTMPNKVIVPVQRQLTKNMNIIYLHIMSKNICITNKQKPNHRQLQKLVNGRLFLANNSLIQPIGITVLK